MAICGLLCGLRDMKAICQYCQSEPAKQMFAEQFGITKIPSYVQFTRIIGIIKIESLNAIFRKWSESITRQNMTEKTIAIDGKTIKSTGAMRTYKNPLHIVSAYVTELGITIGQTAVQSKTNEIPAAQELIQQINICGTIVTADALNCQKETAKLIIEGKGDYVLAVKGNHKDLYEDIRDMFEFVTTDPCEAREKNYDYAYSIEKNRNRIEKREGFIISDLEWLESRKEWKSLACIGMVKSTRTVKEESSIETRFYISSKKLTPEQLITYTRNEWGVESMHWLLDVHFEEDKTKAFDENTQKNLNVFRKIVLNLLRIYKTVTSSKQPYSGIMRGCLFDVNILLQTLAAICVLSFSSLGDDL
jgi:predicted transposase YbfD/YdcC